MKNTFHFSVLAICLTLSACGIQEPPAEHSVEEQEQLQGQAATQETAIEDMVKGDMPQEDVGKYTQDDSIVAKYYGVLRVYGAKSDIVPPD
ncbi:MAG: hypothetical protein NC251_11665 [Lachnoclostridium sp.]|nr:hypothetical protein [Lachnospira sp.]MCM1249074.1 hypothetical protein [Lachnoclostridium sp.]MCM1535797.1 hypothetical protein [Clostridium sp.]